jgi:hypothetical protein
MQQGNNQVPYNPFAVGGGTNPFAASPPSTLKPRGPIPPVGFTAEGTDRSRLLDTEEADVILRRFDREQREAAGAYGKTLVRGRPEPRPPPPRPVAIKRGA